VGGHRRRLGVSVCLLEGRDENNKGALLARVGLTSGGPSKRGNIPAPLWELSTHLGPHTKS
jgi:hypothetical protein